MNEMQPLKAQAAEAATQHEYGIETLAVHAGARPDPVTGARSTPIYQTTSYAFDDADHAAELFNLQAFGYIYSRITNPTVAVLEERVAALENGRGAVAASTGHAAQFLVGATLLESGDEFISSNNLYGGSITQFGVSFKKLGWTCHFVDMTEPRKYRTGDDRQGQVPLLRGTGQPRRHRARSRSDRRGRKTPRCAAHRRQHAGLALSLPALRLRRRSRAPFDHEVHWRPRQHNGRHGRRIGPLRLVAETTSSRA